MRQDSSLRRGRGASFQVEDLEPRLLFSADAASLLGLPVAPAAPATVLSASDAASSDASAASFAVMQSVLTAPPSTPETTVRHELVFVDASLPEADKLIEGIKSQSSADKVIDVIAIQSGEDGLAIITQTLQQRHDVDAVHIISHGDASGMQIGSSTLDATALSERLGELASWGAALAPDADLLLYGCDLSSTVEGRALVDNLASLTGADVAASNDLTGAASLGGNWVLEYQQGHIESAVVVSDKLAGSWGHVLATTSFQNGTGGYTGTKDTYLALLSPGTDYSTSATLSAGRATTQNGFQTLVKFEDIIGAGATQIPPGAVITNVTLTMYMTSSPTFTNPTFSLYRMLAAWSDTSTYSAMGSGIDGAEYKTAADQTITDSGAKSYTFASNAAMIATVQAWVNNPSSNQGWYLFCDDNSSQASFASSENGTVANRPKLSVTYTMPAPPAVDLDANNSSGATGSDHVAAFTEQTPVTIADVDATITAGVSANGSNLLSMTVKIGNLLDGTAESLAATTTGTNITASYNSGTGVLTLSGSDTAANYQTVLRSVTYNNTSDTPNTASRTISVVVTDAYSSSATATTTLSVTAVNDAPVNAVPGGQTVNNDTVLVFSSGNGNLIAISDADAGSGNMQVTLSVIHGSLTLSSLTGLAFTTGNGTGNASMVFTGTSANINAALAGMTYAPTDTYKGAETLSITTSDLGNTGTGGTKTDTDTVAITVTATNVAPTVSITLSSYAATEQVAMNVHGTGISIADSDAGSAVVKATLSVVSGALTVAAGTTGVTVAGSGTTSVTLTGTLAQINALLAGTGGATATYRQSSDTPPAADTLTLSVNDQGNTGTGGAKTGSASVTINIAAVNDAPTATITQTNYAATEQVALALQGTGMSINDPDAGSAAVKATLSVVSGVLTVSAGTTGVSVAGSGTASVTLTGTLAQINALLAGAGGATVSYLKNSDTPPATDTLTLSVNDQGNTGTGGAKTGSAGVTIDITAVNDAPVNTVPAAQSTNEDTNLVFSSGNGNLISISDVDAGSGAMQVTLSVVSGTLTLSRTTGLSFTTGNGTANASMVFTGTLANINAALAGLIYTPNSNFNGSDTLTIITSDQGNTGNGGALTDTDTVSITVNAVNDAPVNTVPPAQSTNEDTGLVFSSANGNLISISDVDAASGALKVTLSVANGTLTLSRTTGLSFTTGNGTANNSMVFTGTLANINAALAGLIYAPNSNFNGGDTLTIITSDQGNTGTGGTLTDTDTVAIAVNAVNDVPVNAVPGPQATNEDTNLVFSSGNGNLISVSDVDAGSGAVQVTLSVSNGALTLSRTTGLSFTTGNGTVNTSMVFTGTIANINAALAGLIYAPNGNYSGSDTLTIVTSDQGNSGSGGTMTDTDTVAITVNAVNDAPTATVTQPSYSATEQTALNLHGTGLSIADVDAGSATVQASLSVLSGALTVAAGSTGVTVGGSGTGAVTLTGTVTQINALLAGAGGATVTYLQSSDTPPATDTLTLSVNDQGNTGSGGAKTGSAAVTINLTAVNDAPVATISQPGYTATYMTNLTLSGTGIGIGDVDAGTSNVQATLSVNLGVITVVAGGPGVTVSGSGSGTVTLTGTVGQINNLLNGIASSSVKYINNSGTPLASSTLTLMVSDLGNTGTGGAQTDSRSVAIDVLQTALVDAMVVPGLQPADIDAYYGFNAATNLGRDDAGHGLSMTLTGSYGQQADNTALPSALGLSGGAGEINGLQTGGALTIAGWVRFDSTGTGESMIDFGDANNAGIGNIVIGRVASTGNLQFLIDTPGDPQSVVATGAIVDGQWMHVAATVDGSGLMSLYVNGTLVGTAQGTAPVAGVRSHNYVGQSNTAGNSLLDGAVDDLLIAHKALSAEQIATLYDPANGLSVPERSANGTVVGTVLDSSASGSNTVSYTLVNSAGGRFAIDATTGVITVADGALLKYEQASSHTITVRATDSGGDALDTSYVVNLGDVNQAPQGAEKAISALEDTAYTFSTADFGFSDNDDSPANSLFAIKITTLPSAGSLTLNGVAVSAGDFVLASDIAAGKLQFIADANDNGNAYATIGFQVQDDGGTADGGVDLDPVTRTLTINVAAVNDAPVVVIVPPAYSATEQTPLSLHGTGLSMADVDAGNATVQATLSVGSGTLMVNAGSTGVMVTGANTATLTLTGTVAQINDLLAGNQGATLSYLIDSDTPPASDTLTLTASDLGNTGSGGVMTASDTALISITAVNDAPVNTVPGTQSMEEDDTLVFSSANGNLISVSDVDAGAGSLQITLSVLHGSLTLSGVAGLTFITGDGTGDANMVFTGTVAQINAALAGLVYTPNANYNGTDTLTLLTSDQGNTGTGGTLQAFSSVTINVDAVNDAPVNSVPSAQSTNEDTSLVFSSANGNLISVSDVDAGNALMQVSLGVSHGQLSLSGLNGLTFIGGDGLLDSSMVFRGAVADINAALAGLVYKPNSDYSGADTLTIVNSDLGNTGTGGTLVDTSTVVINANAVNDAPVNTVPDAQSTDEDTPLVFSSANGNHIAIQDVDAAAGAVQVTLSVVHGNLTLSATNGLVFTTGNGTANTSMVFTGILADINAALDGLVYTPVADYNGADALTLITSDLSNTGSGGALQASSTVTINVESVNDLPVNNVPPAQSTNEDTVLVFSSGNGNLISITDVDAGGAALQVSLSVAHGTLTLSGSSGLVFTMGDGTDDGVLVFTGTLANINAALAGLTYAPSANDSGADVLTIVTSDLGHSGSGGTLTDTDTVAITVNAVNDAPVNAVPPGRTIDEDTSLVFSSGNGNLISVSDVDAGAGTLQVTLSVQHGVLSLSGVAGLSFFTGDGTLDGTMVFTGSISAINAALAGLVYAPGANYHGPDTLSIVTSDLGNTGAGGIQQASDTVAITVAAVNDAPTGSVVITGTPAQGQTLNASNTLVDADGLGAITYHWLRDGVDTGTTAASYLLTEADVGAVMSVRAVYTDGNGAVEGVTSGSTAAVANVNDLPTGSVTITGTPAQGQTLSAGDNITDDDGLGPITYHWLRNGVDTGLTGATYVLRQGDVGSLIRVLATYTDGHGTTESVFSAALGPIADTNVAPTLGSADILVGARPSVNLPSAMLLQDAFDDDGDVLTIRLIAPVSHGQLTILADGSFQYLAADGFQGTDTFTYAADDGQLQSNVRTVRITVTGSTLVVGPPATPGSPGTGSPGLPDFGGGTDSTPPAPTVVPAPVKPTPAGVPSTEPAAGSGSGTAPSGGVQSGLEGATPGRDLDDGRASSGAYLASPGTYAANQASGFVFRLEAGGMALGINPGNVLFKMMGEGLGGNKPSAGLNLNLSLPALGSNGPHHGGSTLAFTDSTEDRQIKAEKMVVQTSGAVLSIGAVWWAARMSGLLASLMISTPAWRSIDPLPVMGLDDGDGPEEGVGDAEDDPDGMDARAARLFGAGEARELEGIG